MPHETTLRGYYDLVSRYQAEHPQWRLGQTMFNVLSIVRRDLSAGMEATMDYDPYSDDEKIPAFLAFIGEHWDDQH